MSAPDHETEKAMKTIDVELARSRRSASTDLARLHELKWIFRVSLVPMAVWLFLACVELEYNLWVTLSCYAASAATVLTGWGFYRTVLALRRVERRAYFNAFVFIFAAMFVVSAFFLIEARRGAWYYRNSNSPMRKK